MPKEDTMAEFKGDIAGMPELFAITGAEET